MKKPYATNALFIVILCLVVNTFTYGQNEVVQQVAALLNGLTKDAQRVDSLLRVHNQTKPLVPREALKREYDEISENIINGRVSRSDSARVYGRRRELIAAMEALTTWEGQRDVLSNQKNNISKKIIEYSAIVNLGSMAENLQRDVNQARTYSRAYEQNVISSFAASVRLIKEQAETESAYQGLAESMIIFEPGTNERAASWLRNGINILGIVGGVLAYSGYDNENESVMSLSLVGVAATYLGGQAWLTNLKNKDSKAKRSLEALSRNIIYGNVLRRDTTQLAEYKLLADSLYRLIPYEDNGQPHEVDTTWLPDQNVIDTAWGLLRQSEVRVAFWREVISASNEMLALGDLVSPTGKENLQTNIKKAKTLIDVKQDNIVRFRSKIYYLEKQFSERNSKTGA